MDSFTPRRRFKWFFRIGVPFALLLAAVFFTIKFGGSIWLNSQRAQLERILTDATGLKTQIKGTVTATLFPTPGVSLGGISMEYKGNTVLAAANFGANFDLLPLLDHELVPHQVEINDLWLQLPADEHGRPVVAIKQADTSATFAGTPYGLHIQVPDRIELRNTTIVVSSPENKELHYVKGLNLAVYPVRNRVSLLSGHPDGADTEKAWQLQLLLNFDQARFDRLNIGSTRLSAHFGPDSGTANLEESRIFDGNARGTLEWKSGKEMPEYQVNLTLTDFDASKSVLLFRPTSFVNGRLDVSTNLSSKGTSPEQLLANAAGNVQMEGTDLDLMTTNIDALVTSILKSKQYNLVDAVAYFFIGPFAVSATKGLDVADVVREFSKPGTTPNKIKRIHTNWQLTNGVASAQDVALQTPRYLLALKGRVDLVKQVFDNVEIGVINHRGCAIATQKFYGPIASPSMEKPNILLTMTRPMLDALAKSAKGLLDQNCDKPFYSGVLVETQPTNAPQPVIEPASEPAAAPENGAGKNKPGPISPTGEAKDQPQTQVK